MLRAIESRGETLQWDGYCLGFVLRAVCCSSLEGWGARFRLGTGEPLEPSMLYEVHIEMDFGADPLIPLSDVEDSSMFQNHPNIQIRTHEKSGHGFTHTGM